MTREEKMEDASRRYNVVAALNRKEFFDENPVQTYSLWQGLHVDGGYNSYSVHGMMFQKTIENLGTDEQVSKYLPQAQALKIIGCYAQTELGHGSNVAGLETTATLDT